MKYIVLLLLAIVIGLCFPSGKARSAYFAILLAIICFPLGIIFALVKNFK